MAQNESFVFYRSFFNAIQKMSDSEKLECFNSICEYALNEKSLESNSTLVSITMELIKPQIDANNQKRITGQKYGKMGGRPSTKKDNIGIPSTEEKTTLSKRFIKPTVEEIKAYCNERKNNVDADVFFNFYESKGWKVGNNAMKDWKASVRTWEKSRNNSTPTVNAINQIDHNAIDENYYNNDGFQTL